MSLKGGPKPPALDGSPPLPTPKQGVRSPIDHATLERLKVAAAKPHAFNLAEWVGKQDGLLIIDDPVPLKPPTAEQLAARRAFLAEHVDAGAIKLESCLHERDPDGWHDDYSLMPPRRPHVVMVEPGKPCLRIGDEETRHADAIKPSKRVMSSDPVGHFECRATPPAGFDYDAIDRDEQRWLRERAAADKASGDDAPIDRDALRERLRASIARRLEAKR